MIRKDGALCYMQVNNPLVELELVNQGFRQGLYMI